MNWSRPTDSGSTENATLENRILFKILFKFCTYVYHRCRFVLAFSVLAFSTLAYSYLRIPYLRFQSPLPVDVPPTEILGGCIPGGVDACGSPAVVKLPFAARQTGRVVWRSVQ